MSPIQGDNKKSLKNDEYQSGDYIYSQLASNNEKIQVPNYHREIPSSSEG